LDRGHVLPEWMVLPVFERASLTMRAREHRAGLPANSLASSSASASASWRQMRRGVQAMRRFELVWDGVLPGWMVLQIAQRVALAV